MRAVRLAPACFLASMPFAAGPAAAQTIRVRTVDEVTRQPAAGALVSLLTPSGARLRQRLTDHLGRATLTASGPGVYRVRADRIGHPGITSDSLALRAADTVELTIAMPARRTVLPELVATGTSPCVTDPASARSTAALWEEARKALLTSQLTRDRRDLRFTVLEFSRRLGPNLAVLEETTDTLELPALRPFTSIPAAILERDGWIRRDEEKVIYYGPDEALLLSDFFLRTHCFRTEWSRRDGRAVVALRFEPLRGSSADISGALWLDPGRAELTSVDWRYERLPRDLPSGATGTARFEAPLEGGYVVWHWAIRMPHQLTVTVKASDGTPDLGSHPVIESYVEEGGEVLRIESRPPATQPSSRPAGL